MQLKDVCELIVDCEHKTAPTQDSGYPSIRTPNIGRGYFLLDGVNRVSEKTYREWTKRAAPRPGDLIMAREAPVGNVAVVPEGLQPCLGQRTLLIRPDVTRVDPNYLAFLLLGDQVQGLIHAKTNGATVPHLNMKDVRTLELPTLPPLDCQKRIAAVLTAYDELVSNNLRRIQVLEELALALYREWFVHQRRLGCEANVAAASKLTASGGDWEIKKVGEILELKYGKALKQDDRRPGSVPVYGSSGVVGYHDESLVDGPGIIVGRKGNVGSVFWSDEPFYPIDTVYYVESSLPLRYLAFELPRMNLLNSDAAVPGLSRQQVYSLEIRVPPAGLLTDFCRMADAFGALVANLQRQVVNLRRTRDVLLPRLMSGQLTVPTAEGTA